MVFLLLALAGCEQLADLGGQAEQASQDADVDRDGWSASAGDCNEECDAHLANPDGVDVCWGWFFHPMEPAELEQLSQGPNLDQDCDGTLDNQQAGLDFDGDGFNGVPNPGEIVDCVDRDSRIRPGAVEICGDNIDQNCDGTDLPCGEGA